LAGRNRISRPLVSGSASKCPGRRYGKGSGGLADLTLPLDMADVLYRCTNNTATPKGREEAPAVKMRLVAGASIVCPLTADVRPVPKTPASAGKPRASLHGPATRIRRAARLIHRKLKGATEGRGR
jgi:hypothetical protein